MLNFFVSVVSICEANFRGLNNSEKENSSVKFQAETVSTLATMSAFPFQSNLK